MSEPGALRARIHITLKSGVLDPQGKAVQHALEGLGFGGVEEVRQGKIIDLVLDHEDRDAAERDIAKMCESLLANPVIEDYRIELFQ